MSTIRLAGNYVPGSNLYTAWAGYGHLAVVKVSGETQTEIEVQAPDFVVSIPFGGDFVYQGPRNHIENTPGDTNDESVYRYTDITLNEGQTAEAVWNVLVQIHDQFAARGQNIDYNFSQNSNSYANTILSVVGINVADYISLATPGGVTSFPGGGRNLLTDLVGSDTEMYLNLIGTEVVDYLVTGNGDDTLVGNRGNDHLNGGAGDDTADYSGTASGADSSGTNGIVATISIDSSGVNTASVIDNWGGTDNLFNIETIVGTSESDIFDLNGTGSLVAGRLVSLDAGSSASGHGDTINFNGLSGSGWVIDLSAQTAGYNLGSTETPLISGSFSINGFENVVGSSSDDTIEGSASNNIIYGGSGADSLSGGAGDDIIIFDAEDTLVDGGEGRDVGIVSGEAGVTVDLTATGLEVVVGGAGADTFTLDGLGETIQMAAGGAGIDTFTINTGTNPSSSGPVVVWGGEGADIFNINGDSYYSNGILTVNVEGLTADNFADFDLSLLGLGNDFDWDAIDMVVLNPDSEDRFFQNGEAIGVGGQRSIFVDTYSYSGPYDDEGTLVVVGSISANYLSEYDASFLGGSIASIQTLTEFYSYGAVVGIDTDTGEPYELDPLSPRDVYFIDTNDLYTAANANFTSQQTAWDHTDESETEPFEFEQLFYFWVGTRDMDYDTLDDIGSSWFVAGGAFGNLDLSTNGSISVTMPEGSTGFSVTNWLASLTSGGTGGGGGTGSNSNTTNASSGSGTTTVSTFTTGTSFITFDGAAIDPTNTSGGYTLAQAGANVQVDFGGGDVVILENVTLTEWQAAAATQFFGSAAGETLTGTSLGEAFTSGTGDDLIIANGGDDTINYVSGDDVIRGHRSNYGNDTLDLSQYAADQVSFRIVAHDVFIDTPDGTIELDYQVRYELGHTRSNIENIVFSDGTLDDAAIRDRAIADQTSAGDDIVAGSYQTDTISSGAGNDTIYAGSGDDTIIYTSGDDVIIGNNTGYNYGNDTLDLSQYTADQVSFRIVQHDVFIDTPNGTIELDYQVRNELGDARLNIESIVFSDGTLDEGGIAARAIADQVSSGNDVITGSYQSEVITGGAGNDTLSGVNGSDTFVFTAGDGVDLITDYDAANDALEFTGISFIDLTITQTGSDVLIEYGTGDQVTVAGALVADFVETEFLFV